MFVRSIISNQIDGVRGHANDGSYSEYPHWSTNMRITANAQLRTRAPIEDTRSLMMVEPSRIEHIQTSASIIIIDN